jgi:hypothetical protein
VRACWLLLATDTEKPARIQIRAGFIIARGALEHAALDQNR